VDLEITPRNPSQADEITLMISGEFASANAEIVHHEHSVNGPIITVDIITAWIGGEGATVITPWRIEEKAGLLTEGEYRVVVNVNDEEVLSPSFTVLSGPPPEGPISIDFNPIAGDQEQRTAGNAIPGKIYELQINVKNVPEINGWSATVEYDPAQIRYVSGSFQASYFIPGLLALVDEKEESVAVGGTVLGTDAKNSGDAELGTLSFEVLEGFTGSTDLVITRVTFRRIDGVDDKRTVRHVVTITSEAVAGALPGDFNGSGRVDFDDFFLFADAFGGSDPLFDLNSSGAVDFDDFFIFADNFGKEERAKLIALAQQYIGLPATPRLEQNYPNPFNASTTIRYQIIELGLVQLDIFDLTGQQIRTLVNDFQRTGFYQVSWDGTNKQGESVSTGLYLARLQVGGFSKMRKMMLVK